MNLLQHSRFQLAMRVLFWLALVFAEVMALLPMPPGLPTDSLGDKFAHMAAFATLTALAGLGFPKTSLWRTAERLSFVGALIEVTQSIPALQRDCDIRDWIADTAAIVAVTLVLIMVRALLRRRSQHAGQRAG